MTKSKICLMILIFFICYLFRLNQIMNLQFQDLLCWSHPSILFYVKRLISYAWYTCDMFLLFSIYTVLSCLAKSNNRLGQYLIRIWLCDRLTVSGRRLSQYWKMVGGSNDSISTYHKREILQGPYQVVWPLPADVNKDSVSAEFL